ncbi:MAG: cysteine synthase family protein [Bacteroidota bacterium]
MTSNATTDLLQRLEQLAPFIGNTPLFPLTQVWQHPRVKLFAKLEWQQLGGSVKARPAFNMITEAVKRGALRKGVALLDSTSGNTGIAYAAICARLGLEVVVVMPEDVSEERKTILRGYGTKLIYTPAEMSGDEVQAFTRNMYEQTPEQYFYVNQYDNEDNWTAHYHHTAEEILTQTEGVLTHFTCGLGTTGTFMGTTRKLQERISGLSAIAQIPDDADNEIEGWKHLPTSTHPGIFDKTLPDSWMEVSTEESFDWMRRLALKEGLLVSPSSAAAMAGAVKVAQEVGEGTVVTIFPDDASKYGAIVNRIFGSPTSAL